MNRSDFSMILDWERQPSPRDLLTLILAGGQGERLHPLTKDRSKPAVPFAGSYRIIDFTLSNCLNSNLRRIYLLTQYKSQSLDRHLRNGWSIHNPELGEFIEPVPPQRRFSTNWYDGTADAVFQNIYLLQQQKPALVVILSGDHVYRMDYRPLIRFHLEKKARATIAALVYPRRLSSFFGIMQVDSNQEVTSFVEKPADPPAMPGRPNESLVNMGVYVFNTETLVRAVIEDSKMDSTHDFGRDVLPALVQGGGIYAYFFEKEDGTTAYWRDIGTLESYYQAEMDFLQENPPFDLWNPNWPIRSYHPQVPPAWIAPREGQVFNSLVSSGCRIHGKVIHSILSPSVFVGENTQITDSIICNDVTIGDGARLRKAIVDKRIKIPAGFVVGEDPEADRERFLVTESGISVIPTGTLFD
ncbi:MAG TPA: glucose-1-phosphate adenylyltransferase [bacterium]|nr:glucose-1-phosphate adenylyltransferase [bacterium]